jgi:hypothetical protein
MKAWPTAPMPGASSRPRAKSTSASGQAADAFAMVVVARRGCQQTQGEQPRSRQPG